MSREATQFKPGSSGRPRGSKNKLGFELKEMISTALDNVGGVEYLELQAEKNPKAFLSLVAKILPKQIDATVNISRNSEIVGRLQRGRIRATEKRLSSYNAHALQGEVIPTAGLEADENQVSFM